MMAQGGGVRMGLEGGDAYRCGSVPAGEEAEGEEEEEEWEGEEGGGR
jgi:hypothetical protein